MLLRYRMERRMEALSPDALYDDVRWHDELFTFNGIPTDRLKDVYLEAMSQHGDYPLKATDFVQAWHRIKPREGAGTDIRPMGARGPECAICEGRGFAVVYDPKTDTEFEKECPYHCKPVVTDISVRGSARVETVGGNHAGA